MIAARLVLVLCSLLMLGGGSAWSQEQPTWKAIYVLVKWDLDANEVLGTGTAFHIGNGRFVTAAHVAYKTADSEGFSVPITTRNLRFNLHSHEVRLPLPRPVAEVERECVDPRFNINLRSNAAQIGYDVATLKLRRSAPGEVLAEALRIAESDPRVGDVVTVVGFPGTDSPRAPAVLMTARSRVTEVDRRVGAFNYEALPGSAVAAGASGAPVLNEAGHVVGIHYAGFGTGHRGVLMSRLREVCSVR